LFSDADVVRFTTLGYYNGPGGGARPAAEVLARVAVCINTTTRHCQGARTLHGYCGGAAANIQCCPQPGKPRWGAAAKVVAAAEVPHFHKGGTAINGTAATNDDVTDDGSGVIVDEDDDPRPAPQEPPCQPDGASRSKERVNLMVYSFSACMLPAEAIARACTFETFERPCDTQSAAVGTTLVRHLLTSVHLSGNN
jgi:hypothetical protein